MSHRFAMYSVVCSLQGLLSFMYVDTVALRMYLFIIFSTTFLFTMNLSRIPLFETIQCGNVKTLEYIQTI